MGSRPFIVTVVLMFVSSLLSACAQNPSADGVDASAAKQVNTEQSSDEPTLVEETTPMPEPTMMTTAEGEASGLAILDSGASPPNYEVKKDGTLIIGGDVLVSCADLLKSSWEGQSPTPEARRQMRQASKEQVRVCTKAGFPPNKQPQSP
jgi:hypothetical protein